MKKLIVSTLAVLGLAVSGYSQGVITFDASGVATPNVYINGVLDTATDINAELLANTGSGFFPVVTLLLSDLSGDSAANVAIGATEPAAGDISSFGGYLYDNNGNTYQFPTTASGTVVTFEVEGWLGGNSYAGATQYAGVTASFTEALSATSSPINAALPNMGILNLAPIASPEPTTFAIAGLGLASLLAIRRRK